MNGKCALCPATNAPLSDTYKGRALGSALCTCCQVKVYNMMEKRGFRDEDPVIAFRFERMAAVSRERRGVRQPQFVNRASWAAHSCPES